MSQIPFTRIGVMGGAFDPPHRAHLALAQAACAQLGLDRLHIVPTGQAWHKTRTLTAPQHRQAMAQLAFAELPQAVIDPRELLRSGPSYTVDTLRELALANSGAQLFLIIGADQAFALTTWRAWQEILQSATICVADRANSIKAGALFDAEVASHMRFFRLTMPSMDISATAIRTSVSAGQDITPLVCDAVARYIADHHLYQSV